MFESEMTEVEVSEVAMSVDKMYEDYIGNILRSFSLRMSETSYHYV